MNAFRKQCLAATAGVFAVWSTPTFAQATDQPAESAQPSRSASYIDLTAGVGYSSNPFLEFNGDGSAFGRVGVRGVHAWSSERASTSIAGFAEGSTYFNKYDFKSIFSVTGDTQYQVSETVRAFASGGVSGDLSGQLSNRFLYVPPVPEVPDTTLPPPPVTVQDPDLFSFAGRQYRLYGQAGAGIRTGPRTNITLSGGGSRVWFTGTGLNDYTTIFVNGAYNHQLSARTSIGFSVGADRTNYDNSNDHSTIISPRLTLSTRLSEYWDVQGGIGVSFSRFQRDGESDHSTSLVFDGSICHSSETERLCGRIARSSQSLSRAALSNSTSANVDWYKKLDDKQTVQLSAGVTRYVTDDQLTSNFKSHYFRVAASYSRKINDRLSGGADVSGRWLRQNGPDPDGDLTGSLFLRYRLGDLG
jgi:hypothetical protein